MKEIFFKAGRKKSETYGEYRQILKRGDLEVDYARDSDDVIIIYNGSKRMCNIDCDKKTGEFRLFFYE